DCETERKIKSRSYEVLRFAAVENLGDAAVDIGNEQPIADEGAVVQTRGEIREHRAIAGARIDAQHLAAHHLGGDDESLPIEFDGIGHAQITGHFLRGAALKTHAPN